MWRWGSIKLPTNDYGRFTWVGDPGYTDSVALWIQTCEQALKRGEAIRAYRYTVDRDIAGKTHDWYFGIVIGKDYVNEEDAREYLCGGCTDCSGAGGEGREWAIVYQAMQDLVSESYSGADLFNRIKPELDGSTGAAKEMADSIAFHLIELHQHPA